MDAQQREYFDQQLEFVLAELPQGTLESLLRSENKAKLAGILTYHVVAGNVPASSVVKLAGMKTFIVLLDHVGLNQVQRGAILSD